ncbi:MAG: hypothetical protein H6579_03740 [Chitinophagales bacterium]|nr:hypothetical protein [Chitinophagales bacterium]
MDWCDDQNQLAQVWTTLTIDTDGIADLGSLAVGLDSIYGQGDSLVLVSNGGLDTAYEFRSKYRYRRSNIKLVERYLVHCRWELCCAKR